MHRRMRGSALLGAVLGTFELTGGSTFARNCPWTVGRFRQGIVWRDSHRSGTTALPPPSISALHAESQLLCSARCALHAGIPPAPRGVPKIAVSFSIDANGGRLRRFLRKLLCRCRDATLRLPLGHPRRPGPMIE